MKFFAAAVASILASSASAAPQPAPEALELMALRSASPIHFAQFSAAKSGLWLNYKDQNASCNGEDDGRVTVYVKDGGLFLYNTDGTAQQFYVDRSEEGQGKIGYVSDVADAPENAELKGWSVVEETYNYLNFDGTSLIACPSENGWSVWASTGGYPGGNKECLGMSTLANVDANPVSCTYTQ